MRHETANAPTHPIDLSLLSTPQRQSVDVWILHHPERGYCWQSLTASEVRARRSEEVMREYDNGQWACRRVRISVGEVGGDE